MQSDAPLLFPVSNLYYSSLRNRLSLFPTLLLKQYVNRGHQHLAHRSLCEQWLADGPCSASQTLYAPDKDDSGSAQRWGDLHMGSGEEHAQVVQHWRGRIPRVQSEQGALSWMKH